MGEYGKNRKDVFTLVIRNRRQEIQNSIFVQGNLWDGIGYWGQTKEQSYRSKGGKLHIYNKGFITEPFVHLSDFFIFVISRYAFTK